MPFHIERNDITKIKKDVIVNAAKESLLGGGGVDGAIHNAAGPCLLEECKTLGGCKTGNAKITGGYDLPSKYIIHTVGPVWHGGNDNEELLLRSCYKKSLELAKKYNCETIAFPLISSGNYGYPKAEALKIAREEILSFLDDNEMDVALVVFDKSSFILSQEIMDDIQAYIDDNYIKEDEYYSSAAFHRRNTEYNAQLYSDYDSPKSEKNIFKKHKSYKTAEPCLYDLLCGELSGGLPKFEIDESFTEMLLRKIDEKGMKDAECYKKANIDRRHFSKIRSDIHYSPKKETAIALAIALELNLEETEELLKKAGFALSQSNLFDVIIKYFIINKNYNVFIINEVLFSHDQRTL